MRLGECGDAAMAMMQGKAPPSPFKLFVPVWLGLAVPCSRIPCALFRP